jgi:hypothetical protein
MPVLKLKGFIVLFSFCSRFATVVIFSKESVSKVTLYPESECHRNPELRDSKYPGVECGPETRSRLSRSFAALPVPVAVKR